METIKYKLSQPKIEFLQNMQEYLDTKLYFYGSIQRYDYIDNLSDIDICVFTDNVDTIILNIQQYLNVDKKYIKKFYVKTQNKQIKNGHKIFYKNSFIKIEISIYENKYKEHILEELNQGIYIPYFYSIIILMLKYIHMVVPIPYTSLKRNLINSYKKEPNTYFFVTLKK